jgi:hypothetical protein
MPLTCSPAAICQSLAAKFIRVLNWTIQKELLHCGDACTQRTMMVLLLVAALLGGFITFAMLLPYGILVALVGAPFGRSFLTLMAGILLALLRTRAERRVKPASDIPTADYISRPITR